MSTPAPSTPTNFYVQQGNGQTYLLWDITPGATSYQIQRSVDNVNFTNLATPTLNYYLDISVTLNTQYFYTVAAVNGSGSSVATPSQWTIPCTTGILSLKQIRFMAQTRAEMVNSNYVTLPEWNMFINQAGFELYDLLIDTYEDYNATSVPYTTDGGPTLPLPIDFYKALGTDQNLNGDSNTLANVTLNRFNFIDRNKYVYPQLSTSLLGVFNPRYKVFGDTIRFIPPPPAGQTITFWYIPRFKMMLQETDVLDGVSGWSQYVIIRAAKYALDKQEANTDKLDAELAFLKDRIEISAQNRDAGEPATISDTRNNTNYYGWGAPGDGQFGGY